MTIDQAIKILTLGYICRNPQEYEEARNMAIHALRREKLAEEAKERRRRNERDDVWGFLHDAKVPVNPLYECGFSRVGCIGCPMASKARYKEFARWPGYQKLYIRAFEKMIEVRRTRGLPTEWETGDDVLHWWMDDGVLPGQLSIDDMGD